MTLPHVLIFLAGFVAGALFWAGVVWLGEKIGHD